MFPLLLSQFREEGKRALSSDLKPLIKGRKQVGVLLDMYLCYGARNFGEGRIVIIRPLAAMGQEQRDKSEKVAVGAVRTPRRSRPPVGSFDSTSVVLSPIERAFTVMITPRCQFPALQTRQLKGAEIADFSAVSCSSRSPSKNLC